MFYFVRWNFGAYGWAMILAFCAFIGAVGYMLKMRARKKLAKAIVGMGNLAGKKYNEFVAALGEPAERSRVCVKNNEMATNATWRAGGLEIVLMFNDEDRCIRLVSESVK